MGMVDQLILSTIQAMLILLTNHKLTHNFVLIYIRPIIAFLIKGYFNLIFVLYLFFSIK